MAISSDDESETQSRIRGISGLFWGFRANQQQSEAMALDAADKASSNSIITEDEDEDESESPVSHNGTWPRGSQRKSNVTAEDVDNFIA